MTLIASEHENEHEPRGAGLFEFVFGIVGGPSVTVQLERDTQDDVLWTTLPDAQGSLTLPCEGPSGLGERIRLRFDSIRPDAAGASEPQGPSPSDPGPTT
jgi:hypothetical protein